MDICHLKNTELERGNSRITMTGLSSEVTWWMTILALVQCSQSGVRQHHKWRPQKVMDVIARLPGCAGQAADAVSAYTLKKWKTLQNCWRLQSQKVQIYGCVFPRHKWPKQWSNIEDLVVPLERNVYGHPVAGLLWERPFGKVLLGPGWEKVPIWECLFVHRKPRIILVGTRGRHQNGVKESRIWVPCGRNWRTWLVLENPHHFLTTCTGDAQNVNANRTRTLLRNTERCSNHEFLQEPLRNYLGGRSREKGACKDVATWPIRTLSKCSKSQLPITSKGSTGNSWWIVQSLLSNRPEMPKFITNWCPWHSVVCKQTCKSSHKMNKSLWQTLGSFVGLLQSSHEWPQKGLSCG